MYRGGAPMISFYLFCTQACDFLYGKIVIMVCFTIWLFLFCKVLQNVYTECEQEQKNRYKIQPLVEGLIQVQRRVYPIGIWSPNMLKVDEVQRWSSLLREKNNSVSSLKWQYSAVMINGSFRAKKIVRRLLNTLRISEVLYLNIEVLLMIYVAVLHPI